ncbi:VRR-NUC domain containing protein [uncultured Caudovirales phage]|uniref:VRR-NUC domain containing protein n=1 Tax=uncultured Caudovirales phage TaxID=2100421 RepID=A0A6J5LQB5_9CAUD|nr:VRR-NUC domain containing protein [uncultured Caudovirales phage]CAB4242090.1 VRR-NUC domain containing protein [uncultured Caudovirales phage]
MKQSEHIEQTMLIRWFRLQHPILHKCLWAIPNGGVRNIRTAVKLKDEGVLAGVSDLFLMIPKGEYHGMFIEMKAKGGQVQASQKEFMSHAQAMGYKSIVCFGFDEARIAITNYLLLS